MDKEKLRTTALSDASDDWYGFYELIWELNSAYPQVPRSEKVELAKQVLSDLLAEGLIDISFVPFWPSNEHIEIELPTAAGLLGEESSWFDPADSPKGSYYAFSATPAGRSAFPDTASIEPGD